MSEIPEEVMRVAEDIIGGLVGWGQQVDNAFAPSTIQQDAEAIARALMAEREGAAMKAETLAGRMEQAAMNGFSLCEREQNALRAEVSRFIAAAIRKGQG